MQISWWESFIFFLHLLYNCVLKSTYSMKILKYCKYLKLNFISVILLFRFNYYVARNLVQSYENFVTV